MAASLLCHVAALVAERLVHWFRCFGDNYCRGRATARRLHSNKREEPTARAKGDGHINTILKVWLPKLCWNMFVANPSLLADDRRRLKKAILIRTNGITVSDTKVCIANQAFWFRWTLSNSTLCLYENVHHRRKQRLTRPTTLPLYHPFRRKMFWYPGGSANASNTCIEEEGEWESHRWTMWRKSLDHLHEHELQMRVV